MSDQRKISWRIYVVSLFAAIGGFCFGYDTGVISVSKQKKQHYPMSMAWCS